jgi:hypothetical protein
MARTWCRAQLSTGRTKEPSRRESRSLDGIHAQRPVGRGENGERPADGASQDEWRASRVCRSGAKGKPPARPGARAAEDWNRAESILEHSGQLIVATDERVERDETESTPDAVRLGVERAGDAVSSVRTQNHAAASEPPGPGSRSQASAIRPCPSTA